MQRLSARRQFAAARSGCGIPASAHNQRLLLNPRGWSLSCRSRKLMGGSRCHMGLRRRPKRGTAAQNGQRVVLPNHEWRVIHGCVAGSSEWQSTAVFGHEYSSVWACGSSTRAPIRATASKTA
eukprot:229380-Prymnesium_polylepis.6